MLGHCFCGSFVILRLPLFCKVVAGDAIGNLYITKLVTNLQTVRIWRDSGDRNYACGHTLNDHSAEVRICYILFMLFIYFLFDR